MKISCILGLSFLFMFFSLHIDAQTTNQFTHGDSLLKLGEFNAASQSYINVLQNVKNDNNNEAIAETYLKIGLAKLHGNNYDSALHYYNILTQLPKTKKVMEFASQAHNNMAYIYSKQGKMAQSLEELQKALGFYIVLDNDSLIASGYYNLGITYRKMLAYEQAIGYYLKAIEILENEDYAFLLGTSYKSLANVLREQNKFQESLEYHQKAIQLKAGNYDAQGLSTSYNDIGITYKMMEQYDTALYYFQSSLRIKDSLNSSAKSKSKSYSNLGETYLRLGEMRFAQQYLEKSLELKEQSNDKKGIAYVLTQLGELYLKKGNFNKSLDYLHKGIEVANNMELSEIAEENLKWQKEVYKRKGDYQTAYELSEKYQLLHDKIFNEKSARNSDALRIGFEVDKKQRELLALYKDNEMQQLKLEQQSLWNIALIVLSGLLVVIACLLFFGYRLSRKNAVLQKSLLHDAQHRTKNFLQTLISLFSFQASQLDDARAKAAVKEGENRVNAMMMIHRYFAQPDLNQTKLDFSIYAQELSEQLRLSFQKPGKKTALKMNMESVYLEAYQSTPLGLILNELVSNSFKYANDKEESIVEVQLQNASSGELHLQVKDNGPGLSEDLNIDELNSSGLKLVRLFTKQLKGRFNFSNQNGLICNVFVKI